MINKCFKKDTYCTFLHHPLVVLCPELTGPTNGEMAGFDRVGDAKVFQCHTGHELQGAANTTCQEDGTWSDPVPSCTRKFYVVCVTLVHLYTPGNLYPLCLRTG